MKFRVSPISLACNCPFYLKDTKGKSRCFIKTVTTLAIAQTLVEPNEEWEDDIWDEDCGGETNSCSVVPLLYTIQPKDNLLDAEVSTFNPFEDYPESDDPGEEEDVDNSASEIPFEYNQILQAAAKASPYDSPEEAKEAQARIDTAKETKRVVYGGDGSEDRPATQEDLEEVQRELTAAAIDPLLTITTYGSDWTQPEEENRDANDADVKMVQDAIGDPQNTLWVEPIVPVKKGPVVEIHQIASPYAVKLDVLVYPVDNTLLIDEDELVKRSNGQLDYATKKLFISLNGKIPMGAVYPVGNGGEGTFVKAKDIYLSVVAGTGKQVRPEGIITSTQKVLLMAENSGVKVIGFIPPDKGMLDLNTTALTHLGAIREFLKRCQVNNLTHIFVLMDDEETKDVYEDYMERIFTDYN